jgi:hypothetical protein
MSKIQDREYYISCIAWWLITSDWVVFNNGKINQMVWLDKAKRFEKEYTVALNRWIHEVEQLLFNKTESSIEDWQSLWLQPTDTVKKTVKPYNKQNVITKTRKKITENFENRQTIKGNTPKPSTKKRKPSYKQITTVEQLLEHFVREKTPKKFLKNQYWSNQEQYTQQCYETYVTQLKTIQGENYLSCITQKIRALKNAQQHNNKSVVATRQLYKDIVPLIKTFVDTIRAQISYHENISNISLAPLFSIFFNKTIQQIWINNTETGETSMLVEKIMLQEDILEQEYLPKVLKWLIKDILQHTEVHDDMLIQCDKIHNHVQKLSSSSINQLLTQKTVSRDFSLKKSSLRQLWIDYYTDICVLEQIIANKTMQSCKEKLLSFIQNKQLLYHSFSQSLRWSQIWYYAKQINERKQEITKSYVQ